MKNKVLLFSAFALIVMFIFSSCEKDEYLDWKYLNERWLEEHKNDSGWITEPSGLQYKVNYPGILLDTPNSRSIVVIQCATWYINGDTIQKMLIMSDVITNLVPGIQEGLKKMKLEAEYEFRVPYNLGYGDEEYTSIPPYTTLNFKVKLRDFQSYNPY